MVATGTGGLPFVPSDASVKERILEKPVSPTMLRRPGSRHQAHRVDTG
jgi:hypothetical protein